MTFWRRSLRAFGGGDLFVLLPKRQVRLVVLADHGAQGPLILGDELLVPSSIACSLLMRSASVVGFALRVLGVVPFEKLSKIWC